MFKMAVVVAVGPLISAVGLAVTAAGVMGAIPRTPGPAAVDESGVARSEVPAQMLALYQEAAPQCPGMEWTLLAAVGTVESRNGTADLPGVKSGANAAGAEGPMQFEPGTFARYLAPPPPGGARPPNPYDPTDAVYAA